jgi:transcriptional antiterminator RfaH
LVNSRPFSPTEEIVTLPEAIAPGDDVSIASGPLQGATGTVTRLLPGRERVRVLLEFLGSTREVEVPLLSVLGVRGIRELAANRGL